MKTKKIFSLLFALLISVSAFTVSASAAEARYVPNECCRNSGYVYRWDDISWNNRVSFCCFGYGGCRDYFASKYSGQKCVACGTVQSRYAEYNGYYCPSAGDFSY